MAERLIEIEVVYAAVDRQLLLSLAVAPGTSLRAAVLASGIATQFPELDIDSCPLGVFGKVVADAETRSVQAGDRIEIYRPLLADPKEVRRLRAAKAAEARRLNP
ncbi:RnfH family protein [Pseudomonas proteolytica]|uniref:RnfH family protein n=1 Tax=Pseudomonas TaxID=286 RepID=UPI000CF33405|nr:MULTISPECIES: RnfH family protein [Pseudomonas]MDF3162349.1 RnfH family protein [Pseudomonas proteolytica]NMZ07828.1 RnfH family protein [Pseudomonas proteolytica]NMZ11041.1 RnfH family protein [Pseudomonas proteolytica]